MYEMNEDEMYDAMIEQQAIEAAERERQKIYASEITCPHCGCVETDSWEMEGEVTDDWECSECEEVFTVERCVSVTYVSYPTKKVVP